MLLTTTQMLDQVIVGATKAPCAAHGAADLRSSEHCRVRGNIRRIQVRSVHLARAMLSRVLSNTADDSFDEK